MNSLLLNKDYIPILKEEIANGNRLYKAHTITNAEITPNCISIIMTASNRSAQTYFTLKTIAASIHKNVQVILVDDSSYDPCTIETLNEFSLYIDFIQINRDEKRWFNPAINYNIGFQFIKGDKIVIQNAEVCHIGDCLNDLATRIKHNDNAYYTYDIITVRDYACNKILHGANSLEYSKISQLPIYGQWYQSRDNIKNLHFLVALSKETFNKINCEFSYDYAFAFAWDDDDFLLKIVAAGINIVNLHYDEVNIMGIHQYHEPAPKIYKGRYEAGELLYNIKKKYYDANNIYIDLTQNIDDFDNKLSQLMYST